MKRKTKRKLAKFLIIGIALFVAWLTISFSMGLAEGTTGILLSNKELATDIVNNLSDNIGVYSFLAAALAVLYYFFGYKK